MSVTAEHAVESITAQQGPVGGNNIKRDSVRVLEKPIREITTWQDTGETPRLRGVQIVLEGGNKKTFGSTEGTTQNEKFDGGETFTRLDVFTTTKLGGRVTGFTLYWQNDNGKPDSKTFGAVPGDLSPAEFHQPAGNLLGELVFRYGLDIDAMGVAWTGDSPTEAV